MKSYSITDIGKKRQINQDYIYTTENKIGTLPNIFLLADGMGGHKAGDYASKNTVAVIVEEVRNSHEKDVTLSISNAVTTANQVIFAKSKDENFSGMGTTIVVATCDEQTLKVANIGDSRLYIIKQDSIKQITRDHSYVEEMIRIGTLKRENARSHPDKNMITRAVGVQEHLEIDFFEEQLELGDIVLICSDGLSNMLEDSIIMKIVNQGTNLETQAKNLVHAANNNGGKDNISVILMKVDAGGIV